MRERPPYRPDCSLCEHLMIEHGTGYVDLYGKAVMVIICMQCPRLTCIVKVVPQPKESE
jgi:hypothetical protein